MSFQHGTEFPRRRSHLIPGYDAIILGEIVCILDEIMIIPDFAHYSLHIRAPGLYPWTPGIALWAAPFLGSFLPPQLFLIGLGFPVHSSATLPIGPATGPTWEEYSWGR
jgi:hypothetical protein